MRHHVQLILCALVCLLFVAPVAAGEKPTLIPGYVDADGTVHPEKLLSYVDALHRAADAEKAEARIVQLQSHLSQVVVALSQTRQQLAQQTQRADSAEQLANNRAKDIDRLANLYKTSQANLAQTQSSLDSTRTALVAETTRTSLLQADRSRLQKKVKTLITSVQHAQDGATRLTNQLDRTEASLAATTAASNAMKQQVTQLSTSNQKLNADVSSTRQQLATARGELATAAERLEAAETARTKAVAELKAFADKTKPATVEPDTNAESGPANRPDAAPAVIPDGDDS